MTRLLATIGLVLLSACAARSPRFPGPLGPVGKNSSEARPPLPPPAARPPSLRPDLEPPTEFAPDGFDEALVASAEYYLSHRPPRDDCSGYVCAVYSRLGLPLAGSSRNLWDAARDQGNDHRRKIPDVGDVAFFDDTYDSNHNGRWDDELSHVALVLAVESDGTILMAHGGTGQGRTTLVMNLKHPEVHEDAAGKVLNTYLRRAKKSDPRSARYLSGELWHGFASFAPDGAPSEVSWVGAEGDDMGAAEEAPFEMGDVQLGGGAAPSPPDEAAPTDAD